MNRFFLSLILPIFVIMSGAGCSDNDGEGLQNGDGGSYTVEAKYPKIRSYRDGGGVFIISMMPDDDFSGEVALTINADSVLNAELDRHTLDRSSAIAEVAIYPDQSAKIEGYEIELRAVHSGGAQSIMLWVEMFDWGSGSINDAIDKRDEILGWLEKEHPEFGSFSERYWFTYMTYPETLVVEHWTFLNMEWEMRLCYHVMIPPYDWSMLAIRRRGELDSIFTAKRESDGKIHEIPFAEYPKMYGY